MKISDQLSSAKTAKVIPADFLDDWPRLYYDETDAAVRLAMLQSAIAAEKDPEGDAIRMELFNLRYKPNVNAASGYADEYMRCFMEFSMTAKNNPGPFGMRSAKKKILKGLKALGIGAKEDELYESILLDEFTHAGLIYISLSMDSRQYSSIIFGFGRLNDQALARKLHKDLASAGIDIADMFDLHEEMRLWVQGLENARERMIPQTAPFVL